MIITKIMIMIIYLSICEAGSLIDLRSCSAIGVTASRININTNIIITKYVIITKHY